MSENKQHLEGIEYLKERDLIPEYHQSKIPNPWDFIVQYQTQLVIQNILEISRLVDRVKDRNIIPNTDVQTLDATRNDTAYARHLIYDLESSLLQIITAKNALKKQHKG